MSNDDDDKMVKDGLQGLLIEEFDCWQTVRQQYVTMVTLLFH